MTTLTSIKGGKELAQFLQTLPVKLQRNVMRGAMRAGAKVIANEAKLNAPVDNGDLRKSIRISTKSSKKETKASVKVGNRKVFYAHFVEFGTAAHRITSVRGLNIGGIIRKEVNHPGTNAKPFMRPALDTKSNAAIREVGSYIGRRLNKQGLNAPAIIVEGDE